MRLRTTATQRFKKVEHATALIWKILQVAESTFRRLKGAELLPAVYVGAQYIDGVPRRTSTQQKIAAWWLGSERFPCPGEPEGVKRPYALHKLWLG